MQIPEYGSCQAQQLSLAHTEVRALLSDHLLVEVAAPQMAVAVAVEPRYALVRAAAADGRVQPRRIATVSSSSSSVGGPDGVVRVLAERVQVEAH